MRIGRILWVAVTFCLGMAVLEAVYFGGILGRSNDVPKAGAIVVFRGGTGTRMPAGVALLKAGYAPKLVLSPVSRREIRRLPAAVARSLIIEDKARTTFENALYTRDIVINHGIQSLILVTSDYHAPRSYLLLKVMLLGRGVEIRLFQVPGKSGAGVFPVRSTRSLKILYNEMVKLWGSLGEWAVYIVRGKVPERSPKKVKVLQVMKGMLLFKV